MLRITLNHALYATVNSNKLPCKHSLLRKDQNPSANDRFCGFSTRHAGSEDAEDEGQWKLYFKLYCFLDVESMLKEGVEFAFMFEQVRFTHPVALYRLLSVRVRAHDDHP